MTAKIQPWRENIECDSKGAPRIRGKMESSAGSPERAESWPAANAAPTPGPVERPAQPETQILCLTFRRLRLLLQILSPHIHHCAEQINLIIISDAGYKHSFVRHPTPRIPRIPEFVRLSPFVTWLTHYPTAKTLTNHRHVDHTA